ncbi:hypothetical protein [Staphylococcus warneri]|uniref:hypothetical protein n=1 Tax=Staphylococcus warneri TaxID=1292 RepID=UPI001304DDBA|nr:hypothetical protein [Staphylococcus warneri]
MTNEDAIKVIEIQQEHSRLLGQIEAYNKTLSKPENCLTDYLMKRKIKVCMQV